MYQVFTWSLLFIVYVSSSNNSAGPGRILFLFGGGFFVLFYVWGFVGGGLFVGVFMC